jgi:hypothetical protein
VDVCGLVSGTRKGWKGLKSDESLPPAIPKISTSFSARPRSEILPSKSEGCCPWMSSLSLRGFVDEPGATMAMLGQGADERDSTGGTKDRAWFRTHPGMQEMTSTTLSTA